MSAVAVVKQGRLSTYSLSVKMLAIEGNTLVASVLMSRGRVKQSFC